METTKLINFYENIDQYRPFERVRKLKKLTDNFNNQLMDSLELDFFQYYVDKMEILTIETGKYEIKKVKNFFAKAKSSKTIGCSFNKFTDEYIIDFDYSIISDVIDKTSDFSFELLSYNVRIIKIINTDYINAQKRKDYRILKLLGIEKEKQDTEKNEILLDYSDSTIINKIIILSKLGVIDFLRESNPFKSSTNSLATILSSITGAKTISIQPVLNPLISKETENKNHPFKSEKTVKTVEQQLINLGYKLKDN